MKTDFISPSILFILKRDFTINGSGYQIENQKAEYEYRNLQDFYFPVKYYQNNDKQIYQNQKKINLFMGESCLHYPLICMFAMCLAEFFFIPQPPEQS